MIQPLQALGDVSADVPELPERRAHRQRCLVVSPLQGKRKRSPQVVVVRLEPIQPDDLIGVDDAVVPDVLRIIKQTCYTRTQYVNPLLPIMEPGEFYMPTPVEVEVGGAAVFICNVHRYERIFS